MTQFGIRTVPSMKFVSWRKFTVKGREGFCQNCEFGSSRNLDEASVADDDGENRYLKSLN